MSLVEDQAVRVPQRQREAAIESLTRQEIYDRVKTHLLRQLQKSEGRWREPKSMYRSRDGLKCAVGVLIPDELYDERIESVSVVGGVEVDLRCRLLWRILRRAGIARTRGNLRLLSDLEAVHDHDRPRYWRKAIEYIARREGLRH
jgi:hypothetical protein